VAVAGAVGVDGGHAADVSEFLQLQVRYAVAHTRCYDTS
jgi:hypothetical protein